MAKFSPVRIVLDSALRLPLGSRLVQTARETPVWVVAGTDAPRAAEDALRALGVEVVRVGQGGAGGLDLAAVLKRLATGGITRLMVEGGPRLAAALLAADLVDEAILFQSATVIGAAGIEALDAATMGALTTRLACINEEPVGPDRQRRYERR
jgi:diaminohydroxyphosphoribosylaminopyrimidine deaminase/5-amino-6-(5-phosphoribosylamino)uracil reductase